MSKVKSLGLTEIRVSMGLFDFDVLCVVGRKNKAEEYIDWKYEEEYDHTSYDKGFEARGRCFYKAGYVPVVWIPSKPKTPREYATLAHECIHAVMHLFDWAALPVSADTEEVLTHSTAHLINEILSKLAPKRKIG